MNLKKQAKKVQTAGFKNSGQDSVLAHITPREEGLLKLFGGSGRTDPRTGLKHYDDGGEGGDGGDGAENPGGFGGGDGYGDGATSGGSGWGGEPGGDRSDGGIGMGGGYGGGEGLSFEGPVGFDNSFATSDYGMSYGDFNNAFGDYGSLHGDVNNYGSPETTGDNSFLSRLTKFTKNFMTNKAISAISQQNPVLGMVAPLGLAALSPTAPQAQPGQNVAGAIAQGLMGPLGAVTGIANMFGANIPSIGQSVSQANLDYKGLPEGASGYGTSTTGQTGTNGVGMDWGNTLGGLAGLYSMYRSNNDATKGVNSLQNMYGQNSPYAQALRQQLERRDAAAGRRSQYGPREVELQAKLAQMVSGMAPSLVQGRQNNFQNQMQMMQQLGALYKMGAFKGLGDVFSGMFSGGGSEYIPSSSDLGSMYSGDAYGEWGG